MVSRALYRSRQFFSSIRPRIDAELKSQAFDYLSERERDLFATMTLRDQQHCLDVYRRLANGGHHDRDLFAAALLHDVGKGQIALWHRVAFVLLDAFAPAVLRRLTRSDDGSGWSQALYRCRFHAKLGADLARQAGSSDQVIALIAEDNISQVGERLAALQAADDIA